MQQDIAEYNLYATRQMGMISEAIERMPANQHTKPDVLFTVEKKSKVETLKEAGIPIKQAYEAEKLAAVPEEEFAAIIEEKREAEAIQNL